MKILISIATFVAVGLAEQAIAAPVEFDTQDAHVIVVRPVDLWAGDAAVLDDSLESIRQRRVSYMVIDSQGNYLRGSPNVFQGISDAPITNGVKVALDQLKTKLVSNDRYLFTVLKPVTVAPQDFDKIIESQSRIFQNFVIAGGNPATLQHRTRVKKFFGGVLSVATLVLSADKFGVNPGAQAALGSGLTDDVYRAVYSAREALVPVALPKFDASSYTQIDIRRVMFHPDILGQVIVAYKAAKTQQAEDAAMIKAIVTLSGADTDADGVNRARVQDLAQRQAIWDACVAQGQCKND